MKKNIKNKNQQFIRFFVFSLGITLLTVLGLESGLALPTPRYNCDEGVHPFDKSKVSLEDNSAISHKINAECQKDMQQPFPNQHLQPVDPANHNPAKDNVSVPRLKHSHSYINDSDQNSKLLDGRAVYWKALLWKFEITLQDDFMKNIDLSTLHCAIPNDGEHALNLDFADCEGEDAVTFGGTKIHRVGKVITYEFGTKSGWASDNNGKLLTTGKPIIPGKDPSIDKAHGGDYFNNDTTLDQTRAMDFAIDAFTLDKSALKAWSGTTTSRALVQHLAIPQATFQQAKEKSCKVPGFENTGWCGVQVSGYPEVTASSGAIYHWFPIGTVSTVWKVPTLTPPPAKISCESIDLNPTTINPQGDTALKATVRYSDNQAHDTLVNWAPTQGSILLQGNNPASSSNPFGAIFTANGLNPSVTVTAAPVDPNIATGSGCSIGKTAKLPPPPPPGKVCTDLQIVRNGVDVPGVLPVGSPTDQLSVKVNSSKNLNYRWTAKTGNVLQGTFTGGAPSPGNPGLTLQNTNPVNYSGGIEGTLVTVEGITAGSGLGGAQENGCFDQFLISNKNLNNFCQDLNLNFSGGTVASGSTTLLTANPKNSFAPDPAQVTWTDSGDGKLVRADNNQSCPAIIDNGSATTSKDCRYNYVTTTNGAGSVTITANPNLGNAAACARTITFKQNVPEKDFFCQDVAPLKPFRLSPSGTTPLNTTVFLNDPQNNPHTVNVQWSNTGKGTFIGNTTQTVTNVRGSQAFSITFNTMDPNDTVQVKVLSVDGKIPNANICRDGVQGGTIEKPPVNPPKLDKAVRPQGQGIYKTVSTFTQSQKTKELASLAVEVRTSYVAEYQLIFTPGPFTITTATITDPIATGITGILKPAAQNEPTGKVKYVPGSMNVTTTSGALLTPCQPNPNAANCYQGDIGSFAGVTLVRVSQPIVITYKGNVETKINNDNCREKQYCQEIFINKARIVSASAQDIFGGINNFVTPIFSNEARIQIFCQYILTRAAGDIFLERDLQYGIDINKCSIYKSGTGIIVTPNPPAPPKVPKTGRGDETVPIKHEFCSEQPSGAGIPNPFKELYGNKLEDLSSQICQIKLNPGSSWEKTAITNTIEENKTRLSRWGANLGQQSTLNSFDVLPVSSSGVYHVKGDANRRNGRLTIDNQITVYDEGAKTFIVENGDLIIKKNIVYGGCRKASCSLRDTASLAFIVLNGNIYIDEGVTELSGIFFVQKEAEGTGYIHSGNGSEKDVESSERLSINGSVYGDIQPLFKNRTFAGDPGQDEGSLVIRFDERVILNTPPGLQDLVNIKETEVAR